MDIGPAPASRTETLDHLERLGKIVNAVGVPLIMVLFIAVYFGWIPSPLTTAAERTAQLARDNNEVLKKHDQATEQLIATRKEELELLRKTIDRVGDILKMVDCGYISDPRLRERCLAR